MRQSFFSYGAFAEGQVHYSKFSRLIVSKKKAFIKADAYRLRCGYPIIHVNEMGSLIEGALYELEIPSSFWSVFDELLGVDSSRTDKCFFTRQQVPVLIDNYSKIEAQVYSINPKKLAQAYRKIENGNWNADMLQKPPLIGLLEGRHKEYIFKLSKTKGRDIVPIKLDLYRELMSLELIVDKGRRLALTPLGKEASLFI